METEKDKELWKIAKKRVAFKRHLSIYIIINSFLWIVWYFTDRKNEESGLAWPLFSMLGWGIGLIFQFLSAYGSNKTNSIEKEYQKLKDK